LSLNPTTNKNKFLDDLKSQGQDQQDLDRSEKMLMKENLEENVSAMSISMSRSRISPEKNLQNPYQGHRLEPQKLNRSQSHQLIGVKKDYSMMHLLNESNADQMNFSNLPLLQPQILQQLGEKSDSNS
jgi:hypothetical protein